MVDRAQIVDRVLGLLAGTAVGDGLGAPFEGQPSVPAAALDRWIFSSQTLHHSDDTAMAMVLAEHLAHGGGINQAVLASDFAVAWFQEPMRGHGGGAARVPAAVADGSDWRQAAVSVFTGGSWGNGAAMRVAPVAVVSTSMPEAAELGRRSAEITHAHGRHGAGLQSTAAYLALHGDPDQPLDADAFLFDLTDVVPSGSWQEKLADIRALLAREASAEEAAGALGNDISALGSVPLAVFAFLRYAQFPEPLPVEPTGRRPRSEHGREEHPPRRWRAKWWWAAAEWRRTPCESLLVPRSAVARARSSRRGTRARPFRTCSDLTVDLRWGTKLGPERPPPGGQRAARTAGDPAGTRSVTGRAVAPASR